MQRAALGLVLIAASVACTPVKTDRKGVRGEDAAMSVGDAGASTDAAEDSGEDASVASAAAGSGGMGGRSNSEAGRSGAPSAAGSPSSEPPAAGSGGGPSMEQPMAMMPEAREVQGRVINFFQHAVPGARVTIGETTVTTGDNGEFRIADVPASYDATILIATEGSESLPRDVTRYEGLTRRDPTLQVRENATARKYTNVDVTISGVDFANLAEGERVELCYSGPESISIPSFTVREATASENLGWYGSNTARYIAHAIRLFHPPGQVEPRDFYSYDSQVVYLTDGQPAAISFELPKTSVLPVATFNGTFEGAAGTNAFLTVYLRFPDHGTLELFTDESGPSSFSYAYPSIPGSSITVMAWAGGGSNNGDWERSMHIDGISPTSTFEVSLALPEMPSLLGPPDDATVDDQTVFSWSGSAQVHVFQAYAYEQEDAFLVITEKRETKLPEAPSLDVPSAERMSWSVATHGSFGSVDEAAGPQGFMDTCQFYYRPVGPDRGKGTFTQSSERHVMTR